MVHPARAAVLLLLAATPSALLAQAGPSDPQIIASAPTARASIGSKKLVGHVIATLRVGEDGRVRDVQITEDTVESSLSPQMVKVLQSVRFRPAIDQAGRPIAATSAVKLELRQSTGVQPKPVAANPDAQLTDKEKARIRRMRCADFVWEYDFIRDQAEDKDAVAAEFMPRIATAMYVTARSETGDFVDAKIWKSAAKGLRETVDQCRDAPQALFWQDTFKRIMDEAVRN